MAEPELDIFPGPTATTSPCDGFSFAFFGFLSKDMKGDITDRIGGCHKDGRRKHLCTTKAILQTKLRVLSQKWKE